MTTETIPQAPFKFTGKRLADLPPADGKRYTVKDSDQPGLIGVVYPASATYPHSHEVLQVRARPRGCTNAVRVKIAIVGELPMTALKDQPSVRGRVTEILAKLRQGINPNHELRQQLAEQRQQADADKPLNGITGAMAVTRHAELSKSASANLAMRAMQVLRATHRFATEFYGTEDNELPFGRCPVDKLNRIQTKWSKGKARTGRLAVDGLAPWLASVRNLPAHQKRADGDWARVAVYLELILLTGLRRREAGYLRWDDVDLRRATFTVRATKNGEDHTLPIGQRVRDLFALRQAADPASEYVIGTAQIQRQLDAIEADTGLKISPHDLRRTWASMAERAGVGAYGIKAALNHKTTGDVTGLHYAQVSVEDLRPIMQQVEDVILRHAERRNDNVVMLRTEDAA